MGRKPLDKIADDTFSFRLNELEKTKLVELINQARDRLNKLAPEDEYMVTKNDVILSALKRGLKGLQLDDLPKRNKREDQK